MPESQLFWQEEIDPHLRALAEDTGEPFSLAVLRAMFGLMRVLVKYADSYDLVLGDDVSGRVPALLAWELINIARAEKGLEPASIRLASGKSNQRMPDWFIPQASSPNARTAIVTDNMGRGRSAHNLFKGVGEVRAPENTDIISVSTTIPRTRKPEWLGDDALFLLAGPSKDTLGDLHPHAHEDERPGWMGFTKRTPYDLFAIPLSPEQFDAEAFARNREDIHKVVATFAGMLGLGNSNA